MQFKDDNVYSLSNTNCNLHITPLKLLWLKQLCKHVAKCLSFQHYYRSWAYVL